MTNPIKAGILKSLLSHGAIQSGPLMAWGKGHLFGDPGYTAADRLTAAKTTFAELEAAGFAIQSDTHGRAFPGRETDAGKIVLGDAKDARRATYKNAHGGVMLEYAVNPSTCPSGLRPRVVGSNKAPALAAWHAALVTMLAACDDNSLVVAPPLGGEGAVTGTTPRTEAGQRVTKPTGPTGWRVFQGAMTSIKDGMAAAVNALRMSEDRAVTSPIADAIAAWSLAMPDVSKVTSAAFDTSLIRLDSEVEFIPGAPEVALATFLAKKASIELPKSYRAIAFSTDGSTFDVQPFEGAPFKRPLTVKTANAKRVIRVAPPAPVDPKTWKPTPLSIAYLMGEEVMVLSVSTDGLNATIDMDGSGEGMEVPVSTLTMTAEIPADVTPSA